MPGLAAALVEPLPLAEARQASGPMPFLDPRPSRSDSDSDYWASCSHPFRCTLACARTQLTPQAHQRPTTDLAILLLSSSDSSAETLSYLSVNAATPGRMSPARNSSEAPPPVET